MNLPVLKNPQRYQGLYVFDFGDHVAVGYTAEEIEILQSSKEHGGGQAYRIHSAEPDGRLALRGLSRLDTSVQDGMLFCSRDERSARADFMALKSAAMHRAPPTPIHCYLVFSPDSDLGYVTVLVYSAEYRESIGHWLLELQFDGGEQVESCPRVEQWLEGHQPADHVAIAPHPLYHSRGRAEVLRNVGNAVQRILD